MEVDEYSDQSTPIALYPKNSNMEMLDDFIRMHRRDPDWYINNTIKFHNHDKSITNDTETYRPLYDPSDCAYK